MNVHRTSLGALLFAMLCLCGVRTVGGGVAPARPPPAATPARTLAAVINGNGVFAFDLYRAVHTAKGNLCFSPYNIAVAFGMAWIGARGETAQEMARVLHFPTENGHTYVLTNELERTLRRLGRMCDFQLKAANAVWVQKGKRLQPSYLEVLARAYAASCGIVDMRSPREAVDTINRWYSEATNGMISNMLSPDFLRPVRGYWPVLVLTSSLYFHSAWQYPFGEKATCDDRFIRLDGTTVQCRMMHRQGRYFYEALPGLQIIDIPYRGMVLSMVVLLPDTPLDFRRIEESLTFRRAVSLLRGLRRQTLLQLEFPKFTMEAAMDLTPILQALGMHRAFDPAAADFSGITGGKEPLWLRTALHKAVIKVDEKGTEAAAGTTISGCLGAEPVTPVTVRVDRPFIYLIRERRTGAVFFLGRVLDPSGMRNGSPGSTDRTRVPPPRP